MNSQVGHAYTVGVWVDEGDGDSPSPVFNNVAFFAGEAMSGILSLIPAHRWPLYSIALRDITLGNPMILISNFKDGSTIVRVL